MTLFLFGCSEQIPQASKIDVLVVGGGASGSMAGIQSARLGVSTLIVEATPWLGGMLTSAGVSAIDGNYQLHSGLWEEFRQILNDYYGGAESLKTGWVSNVLFEPQVGAKILAQMTKKEQNLAVWHNSDLTSIQKKDGLWQVVINKDGETKELLVKIVIDATELGDISKAAGIPYDIGMDSRFDTNEEIAPEMANDIVQDLTYVAILKDYGPDSDMTIEKPKNYDPTPFVCTCEGICNEEQSQGRAQWDCDHMMNYGKLPNGYYMINWPLFGNDFYLNLLEMNNLERKNAIKKAKDFTLNYIYYLQSELGYKHLGIADDVFPTEDHLPFIPYHRESRRIKGLVQFDINDLTRPYEQEDALYRTGIAVGDYPIDHHHFAYPEFKSLPDLHFYPVPSYSVPLGALIPKEEDNFIVAEKSISVTNLVNGTTRLQPVCILIGQASGTLAALAVKGDKTPKEVPIRKVQAELLNSGAYILPYSDVDIRSNAFTSIQKIGATGILKGEGINIGWKNHTYIYPDSLLTTQALKEGLKACYDTEKISLTGDFVRYDELVEIIMYLTELEGHSAFESKAMIEKAVKEYGIEFSRDRHYISRANFAILLDRTLDPFGNRQVNHRGEYVN
ncbi:MAG: FAD-dependent oxidoreductase [Maribacter sp.]|nr:FAD-dependent oxidoreductase [Maribacter sp.]